MFFSSFFLYSYSFHKTSNNVSSRQTLPFEFLDDFFFFLVDCCSNASNGLLDLRSILFRCMHLYRLMRYSFFLLNPNKFKFSRNKIRRIHYKYHYLFKKKNSRKKKDFKRHFKKN